MDDFLQKLKKVVCTELYGLAIANQIAANSVCITCFTGSGRCLKQCAYVKCMCTTFILLQSVHFYNLQCPN